MGKKSGFGGIIASTDPDFVPPHLRPAQEPETLPIDKQQLKIAYEKKGRGGKQVTVVYNFVGKAADLEDLARQLKTKLGIGGSVKEGEILMQGDVRTKLADLLRALGYKVKGA